MFLSESSYRENEMFKILIADDERFIRQGIISILKRNIAEELECVEAGNGEEALRTARESKFNLIITDICMPGCDGLEFIKRLKAENDDTTVIILSGYENFEYARKAILLGVKEYIIKPIKKQEFIQTIQSHIDDIKWQKEKTTEEIINKIEQNRMIEQLRCDFLMGLLKCPTSEEARIYLKRLQDIGMNFGSRLYICTAVQYKVNDSNAEYIDFAVKNILDEYLPMQSQDEFVVNIAYTRGMVVTIFEGSRQEELREEKVKLFRRAVRLIKEYFKTRVYVGIGDVAYDSVHLHRSLRQALLAANYKIYEEGDAVCSYEKLKPGPPLPEQNFVRKLKHTWNEDTFWLQSELQQILEHGKTRTVLLQLEKEYEMIQQYIKAQLLSQKNERDYQDKFKEFYECWSFFEVVRELRDNIKLLKEQGAEERSHNPALMKQILRFVDEHITEELDLNVIAEKFDRTSSYISALFKKQGEGFSTYLTRERVGIAKKLLKDRNIPIQEVSELCGYSNSKYFSVVFKKVTGVTPREYREK